MRIKSIHLHRKLVCALAPIVSQDVVKISSTVLVHEVRLFCSLLLRVMKVGYVLLKGSLPSSTPLFICCFFNLIEKYCSCNIGTEFLPNFYLMYVFTKLFDFRRYL